MKIALLLISGLLSLSYGQQVGKDGKTFGSNSCRNSQCRNDFYRAQNCCYSHRQCCQYVDDGNNGNNGFNPGFGGQKPGSCPSYGRKKRSPEQVPKSSSENEGKFYGGGGHNPGFNNGGGYNPGFNNGGGYNPGFNNGGQGFNPGYNNGGYNNCNDDSNCPGRQKCCYAFNGKKCVNPSIYG